MITKFKEYLITESPDSFQDEDNQIYDVGDYSAIAFFFKLNENDTKAVKAYVSDRAELHVDIEYDCKKSERAYPGRLWLDSKVISFWEYPGIELFKSMIKKLESELNIKMFNNDWRIEILLSDDDKKEIKYDTDFYFNPYDGISSLIPIEEYIGSENMPEELKQIHLLKYKERERLKKAGKLNYKGWGSDKTSWDSNRNIKIRQKLYQEKLK